MNSLNFLEFQAVLGETYLCCHSNRDKITNKLLDKQQFDMKNFSVTGKQGKKDHMEILKN